MAHSRWATSSPASPAAVRPAWAARYDGLKEQLFTAHSVVAWILVAMIAVHVLAALKHFFIDKDTVFRRMWFYSAAADGTALVTANDR
ncbi:MAG: cytochrome b/b6 domain-containing protein [Methylibium sp.]|nr:cytochrome b/b6 domain-containing protein [Methylibium sp.]